METFSLQLTFDKRDMRSNFGKVVNKSSHASSQAQNSEIYSARLGLPHTHTLSVALRVTFDHRQFAILKSKAINTIRSAACIGSTNSYRSFPIVSSLRSTPPSSILPLAALSIELAMERQSSTSREAWSYYSFTAWPPRSYPCSFCKREFRSAQALGGHMNVHRRDRARLRHGSPPPPPPPPVTLLPNLNYPPPPQYPPDGSKKRSWPTDDDDHVSLGLALLTSTCTATAPAAAPPGEDDHGLDLELRLGVSS